MYINNEIFHEQNEIFVWHPARLIRSSNRTKRGTIEKIWWNRRSCGRYCKALNQREGGMPLDLMTSTLSKKESTLCLFKLIALLRDVACGFLIERSWCLRMKPESQSLSASFLTDQERGTIHFSWVAYW